MSGRLRIVESNESGFQNPIRRVVLRALVRRTIDVDDGAREAPDSHGNTTSHATPRGIRRLDDDRYCRQQRAAALPSPTSRRSV